MIRSIAQKILLPYLLAQPLREKTKVAGSLRADILDARSVRWSKSDEFWTGDIIGQRFVPNKIPASGRALYGEWIKQTKSVPTHFGIGTDGTAVLDTDTDVAGEIFRDFITQRLSITDGFRLRFFLSSTAANGNTLRRAGILNAATGGDLYAIATYTDIIKTSSVAVNYTWEHVFSNP